MFDCFAPLMRVARIGSKQLFWNAAVALKSLKSASYFLNKPESKEDSTASALQGGLVHLSAQVPKVCMRIIQPQFEVFREDGVAYDWEDWRPSDPEGEEPIRWDDVSSDDDEVVSVAMIQAFSAEAPLEDPLVSENDDVYDWDDWYPSNPEGEEPVRWEFVGMDNNEVPCRLANQICLQYEPESEVAPANE